MTASFDFSHFPRMETDRLIMRQMQESDAPALLAHFGNPETVKYISAEPFVTDLDSARALITEFADEFTRKTAWRWAVTLRGGDDTLIGTAGFHRWYKDDQHAEIGYDLNADYWGKGYATELVKGMVRWGFLNMDLHRIEADVTAGNVGSERVLEKAGFTREGVWREREKRAWGFVDLTQYGILRHEVDLT